MRRLRARMAVERKRQSLSPCQDAAPVIEFASTFRRGQTGMLRERVSAHLEVERNRAVSDTDDLARVEGS